MFHLPKWASPLSNTQNARLSRPGGFESVLTSEQGVRLRSIYVRIRGRWATGEEQLWAALLTPDWGRLGQDGKQAQMHRPEQNSVWGKEKGHPVTTGRWRLRQRHVLYYWSFRKETKTQMIMTLSEPDHFCVSTGFWPLLPPPPGSVHTCKYRMNYQSNLYC